MMDMSVYVVKQTNKRYREDECEDREVKKSRKEDEKFDTSFRNSNESCYENILEGLNEYGTNRVRTIMKGINKLKYHDISSSYYCKNTIKYYDWNYNVTTRLISKDLKGSYYETRVITPSGQQRVITITFDEYEAKNSHRYVCEDVRMYGDEWMEYTPNLIPDEWSE